MMDWLILLAYQLLLYALTFMNCVHYTIYTFVISHVFVHCYMIISIPVEFK